jgi:fumarate reductase flavoprotein subunit
VPRHKINLLWKDQMKRTVLLAGILAALTLMASCASTGGGTGASTGGPSGTADATAQGFGGPVTVTVTLENGKITSVEAEGQGETQGIGSRAIDMLPGLIVTANSAEVDALSGASVTSQAIKTAAREAIAKIGN